MLSPFRYPGGKTWLVPRIAEWVQQQPNIVEFAELFAGGASVGLAIAAAGLVEHVTLIERDPAIAVVWQAIFYGDAEAFADRILRFVCTAETVRDVLTASPVSPLDYAFQSLVKNRCSHGGIMTSGSGLLKHGENGKGLTSRWYPDTLAQRIMRLAMLKRCVTIIVGDGLTYLEKTRLRQDVAYFIDPPYTAPGKRAGRRLYRYHEIDHERLFTLCSVAAGPFAMTYDNSESVREMAARKGFCIEMVSMRGNRCIAIPELLIFPPPRSSLP